MLGKLRALRAGAEDGVFELDAATFEEAMELGPRRTFALAFTCRATGRVQPQTEASIEWGVQDLRAVSRTFGRRYPPGTAAGDAVFFAVMDYAGEGMGQVFSELGIVSVPFGAVLSTDLQRQVQRGENGELVRLPLDLSRQMVKGAKSADEMKGLVERFAGYPIGELWVPSFRDHPLYLPGVATGAALLLWGGGTAVRRGVLQWPPLYAVGALAVFWFATSGGLFMIIRKVPMYQGVDLMSESSHWFQAGPQGQLGIEGFYMGSLYLGFSLGLAFLTYVVPHIKAPPVKRLVSYLVVIAVLLLLQKVFGMLVWKNGYRVRYYGFLGFRQ